MSSRPTIYDLGIDKLPEDGQLAIAHEIFDSIYGPPPGTLMTEEEILEECERRNRELDEHPERALSYEEFLKRMERPA